MTLEDLGNVGEFIAAIATLVTLIYLAVQIRQNTRAVRSTAFQQVVDSFSEISLELGLNREISEIFNRADSGLSSLDAVERRRHQYILLSFFRRAESVFFQSDQGTLEAGNWEGIRESVGVTRDSKTLLGWFPGAIRARRQANTSHVAPLTSSSATFDAAFAGEMFRPRLHIPHERPG